MGLEGCRRIERGLDASRWCKGLRGPECVCRIERWLVDVVCERKRVTVCG